jgi:hypothetical protein
MSAIWVGAHVPPRAVGTPRAFSALAISRRHVGGEPVCFSLHALGAFAAHLVETRVAEPRALGLSSHQRLFGAEIIARSFSASAA